MKFLQKLLSAPKKFLSNFEEIGPIAMKMSLILDSCISVYFADQSINFTETNLSSQSLNLPEQLIPHLAYKVRNEDVS